MKKRYTSEERAQLIAEVKSSAESPGAVAKRLGVNPATAYLWLKLAATTKAPEFARVLPATSRTQRSSVEVVIGSAAIRVEAGFDPELLRAVVNALGASR